jgi:two-component system, sensor histidine kinase and response regulator
MTAFGRHFQVIFEHSPVGMLIINTAGEILHLNRTTKSMVTRKKGDILGEPLTDFLDPEERAALVRNLKELPGSRSRHFETVCRTNPEWIKGEWWKIQVTYIADEGHSPFVFCIVEDITERKSGEEKLKREKESAEKATRTKSAFLANMSHEIRTPLHTITAITELLLDTHLDEEQKEYGDQIRFAADVLLGLINDILDFSKIEAGKLSLEIIEFDLLETTEEAVDMVSLEAHRKGLEVVVSIDPGVPQFVMGDPVRLRQIIVNLFNNAVKFTSKGEIVLKLRLYSQPGKADQLLFEVQDTGIGIPEDKVDTLFRAFSQVDSSTTRKFGGTGLGLSICKSLVGMMGGSIGVKSVKDVGSNFWFTLPVAEPPVQKQDAFMTRVFMQNEPILIVDDNRTARAVISRYLTEWGATVEEAESGQQALDILTRAHAEGRPVELAIVDQEMKGMDGWQFASEVNSDKSVNSTRLILMTPTGKSTGEAKMKLLRWFNAYLNKPVKYRQLYQAVYSVLRSDVDLEEGDEDSLAASLEPVDETEAIRGGHTILVVEDHFVNQQLFQTILEKLGHTTILASNGREAVEIVRSRSCDLVFMDLHMPEMNGYEATETLRAEGYNVPIVAVTANALKGEKDRCLEVGMNGYLSKPFRTKDLLPFLSEWLPKRTEVPIQQDSLEEDEPAEEPETLDSVEDAAPDDTQVFHYEGALNAFLGKKDVVARVLRQFMEKTEQRLPEIQAALEQERFEDARNDAHAIKGGAWNLEANRLGDAAKILEDAARDKRCQDAVEALSGVSDAFETFKRLITEMKICTP